MKNTVEDRVRRLKSSLAALDDFDDPDVDRIKLAAEIRLTIRELREEQKLGAELDELPALRRERDELRRIIDGDTGSPYLGEAPASS